MNPGHRITVAPNPRRVIVRFGDQLIVDTRGGLVLQETGLPPVQYLPRADADMRFFERSALTTHCPYKGEASYFSLVSPERTAPDAVWTYETPNPEVSAIAGHLAFYPDQVTITEED